VSDQQMQEVGEFVEEVFDVLAARAQRAEAAGTNTQPFRLRIGESVYEWPAELPAKALELVSELQAITKDTDPAALAVMTKLLRLLSGQDADELLTLLSINDLVAILPQYIEKVAGSRLGESPASPASSRSTPRPRKRTSKRTTGSTSSTTTAAV
jgi:hypothetical protein